MHNAYLKSISSSGLFKYLDPSHYQTAWLELHMAPRSYRQGQTIYGQDDPVTRAGIVHVGLVRGERLSPDGASSVPYYYESGELFAYESSLSGRKTSPLHISAETDTEVIFFDIRSLFPFSPESDLANLQLLELRPLLLRGLFELLANDDIKKLYRIEALSKRSLRERIMTHFHILASKSGEDTFILGMSREQLAHYLCVNRSALSHELNQMKRDGLIVFKGREFRIVNR